MDRTALDHRRLIIQEMQLLARECSDCAAVWIESGLRVATFTSFL